MSKPFCVLVFSASALLHVQAATYYVDASRPDDTGSGTSWVTAKKTIQAAVNLTVTNDTVLVTNGVYNAGATVTPGYSLSNRVVITKSIKVQSLNGPQVTVIEGSGTDYFDKTAAVRCVFMTKGTLSGFELRNGTTLGYLDTSSNRENVAGGGVSVSGYVTNAVITNCIISGCRAYVGGGSYGGLIEGCILTNNASKGWGSGADCGVLNQCLLTRNTCTGGAAHGCTLNSCAIIGNTGETWGGGSDNCILNNCLISGNISQYYGGGSYFDTANNCLILGNTAPYGGGSYHSTLNNCTLVGNIAPYGGGSYACSLNNCIAWSNRTPEGVENNYAGSSFFHSCTVPLATGEGNIDADPLFVGTNDLRLATASPCVDGGANGFAPGLTDFFGNPRIYNHTVDMGACENTDPVVSAPTFCPASGDSFIEPISLTITCSTADAVIWYTLDGKVPTVSDAEYVGPIALSKTTTVKAIAFRSGMLKSDIAAATYTALRTVATPAFTPPAGTLFSNSLSVAITCMTQGSVIRYTLDGTEPTDASAEYTGAIVFRKTTTVKAKAFQYGMNDSPTATATYGVLQIASTPIFTPASGTCFKDMLAVTMTCATEGATIRFTLDGSDPTDASTEYEGSITLVKTTTLKAKAFMLGMDESATAIGIYRDTQYYVDASRPDDSGAGSSWASAKQTIQAAVDSAQDGDVVLVTNGVYNIGTTVTPGSSLRNRLVITNSITVRSAAGPLSTIIVGSGTNSYGTSSAIRCVYMSNGRLEGFTLRYGETSTPTTAPATENNCGGGLRMKSSAGAGTAASNCVIESCRSSFGGGAGYGVIYDCILKDNKAMQGGGSYYGTLNRCMLSKNTATSTGGGSFYGILNNCVSWGNKASSGGGGSFQGTLNNCTVAGNSSNSGPGGCYYGTFNNCIVWGNSVGNYGNGTFTFSCTTPLPSGSGNIDSDPLFKYAATNNYQLQAGSPCISRGTNSYVVGMADLLGNPRIQGLCVDMGAYEYSAVFTPVFTPPFSTQFTNHFVVAISCATTGSVIRYTLDGSEPAATSPLYNEALTLTQTTTVKAKAFASGLPESATASATYYLKPVVATPVFLPASGAVFSNSLAVSITSATDQAVIRYTQDGSEPTEASPIYTEPVLVTETVFFNAKAFHAEMDASTNATARYRFALYYVDASRADDSGSGTGWATAKKTLQAAIDQTVPGDVVLATNGVYAPFSASTNAITIASVNGAAQTLIDGGGTSRCATFSSTNTVLTGFMLTNGYTSTVGGGAYYGVLNRCMLVGNYANDRGGGSYFSVLNNCILSKNSTRNLGGGSYGGVLNNCTIVGNNTLVNNVGGCSDGTLNNCIIWGNTCSGRFTYNVEYCSCYNCCTTPSVNMTNPMVGNLSSDPLFESACDFRLQINSPCLNAGSNGYVTTTTDYAGSARIQNGVVDIGSYEGSGIALAAPTFLPPSGASFTNSLQVTMSSATEGSMIRYTVDGTLPTASSSLYAGPVTLTQSTTVKARVFKEGFEASAIPAAVYTYVRPPAVYFVDISRPDDSADGKSWATAKKTIQAALNSAVAGDAVLVTNGVYSFINIAKTLLIKSVNGAESTIIDSQGAGHCATLGNSSLPTNAVLDGFTLRNGATGYGVGGGGAYYGTLNNCVLTNNSATYGGGAYYSVLNNCVLVNNTATYGGGSRNGTLRNCTLMGNRSTSGGADANGALDSCLLVNNIAQFGGGSYYSTLNNCTLSGNTTTAGDSSVVKDSTLYNCIVWANITGNGAADGMQSTSAIDPRFAGPEDFRLLTDSPFRNAGNNDLVIGTTDLLGNPRIQEGVVDLGAFEGGVVVTPTFVPPDGTTFVGMLEVTIQCSTPGAVIRFTVNGSEPTSSSKLYTKPIQLSLTTTIRAKAFTAQYGDSQVVEATYTRATLAESLDAHTVTFATGGSALWFGQTNVTHDGVDAAQSGAITDGGVSWMETDLTGPGVVAFWWKVSCEDDPDADNWDFLNVSMNGNEQARVDGETNWQWIELLLPAGENTLRWSYTKDNLLSAGADCGWVDQLTYRTVTESTPVPVPYSWMFAYPTLVGQSGDVETAAMGDADQDGYLTWQEYVAGTCPTNRESVPRSLISVSNDTPWITWSPDLGTARVYSVWGKTNLTDAEWGQTNAASRFFRVRVDMP